MNDWTEWPVDGWPEVVRYRRDVLHQISGQMTAGFRAYSWGGVEVGGVLFGTRDGSSFSISGHRPVDCEHANGPSYELTDRDRDSMRKVAEEARSEDLEPIGWYKSVSNRELAVTEADHAVWADLFPLGVMLILKRSKEGVKSGATFCRADGRILSGRRTLDPTAIAPQHGEMSRTDESTVSTVAASPDALTKPEKLGTPEQQTKPEEPTKPDGLIEREELTKPEEPTAPEELTESKQLIMPSSLAEPEEPAKEAADPTAEPRHPVDAFALTPDPDFFYASPCHAEALASLEYGISGRKGFVMLVGDSGTGKTMLLECLSDRLTAAGIEYGFLFNSRLSRYELFELLALDFDLKPSSITKTSVLLALNDHLLQRADRGQITALLIDDAQKLSVDVLAEIELLSNLETRKGKLLQVVMAARPEFESRMNQPELAGLRQRFVLRPRLGALSVTETAEYIRVRLDRAGESGVAATLPTDEIHRLSGGVPRLINAICGQLLERHALNGNDPQAALAEVADELGLIA